VIFVGVIRSSSTLTVWGLRQTQAAETGTDQQHNVNVTVNDSVKQTILIAAHQPRNWPCGFDVREHLSSVVAVREPLRWTGSRQIQRGA